MILMDSRLRGNDGVMKIQSFYESINNGEENRSTPTYNGLLVPFTLVLIFLLLYFNFRNLAEPVIVMLSIPFALVGGIACPAHMVGGMVTTTVFCLLVVPVIYGTYLQFRERFKKQ